MHLTPAQGLDGGVDDVGTVVADLEDAGHREARAAVAVILYDDVGVLGLDGLGQCTKHGGLSDACHVFQADFLSTGGNHLVGNLRVVFHGMHGAGGDAECGLRNHAGSLGPLDRGDDIACVVQAAEDTGDIHTLCMLHLIHQFAHVIGHGVHAQGIETAVEHVGLYTYLVEGFAEGAHSIVGVFACHQVHLLKGTTIGFHTCKAPHVDDDRGNALQLILAGLELATRLPHVAIDEAELNLFLSHS